MIGMLGRGSSWWWTFGIDVAVLVLGLATIWRCRQEARRAMAHQARSVWFGRSYSYEFWVVAFLLSGLILLVLGVQGLIELSVLSE